VFAYEPLGAVVLVKVTPLLSGDPEPEKKFDGK